MTTHTILQPAGWAKPKGYANGVAAQVVSRSQLGATALSSWPKCS